MQRFFLFLLITFIPIIGLSQDERGSAVGRRDYGMVRTNMSLSYDHTWGDIDDGFTAKLSYQFLKRKNVTLTGNFKYSSVSTNFVASDLTGNFIPEEIALNDTHTMEQIGVTATASANIGGKQFMGMAILNSEWGRGGFNRVSMMLMASVLLRSNSSTQFGLGLMGMINSTSKVPVFPVVFYRHRFNSKWTLNLYGAMFYLDYTPSSDSQVSIGADIDAKSFYFKPSDKRLPETCRYTQTNFRPMLKYRHSLIPNLYFDIQGGCAVNMSSRVNGVNGTKEFIRISQRPHPFIQLSCSYSL